MTAAAISAFRDRSATVAHAAHGTEVSFRGETIKVIIATIAIGLDLETGGLRQGGEFTCRILSSAITTPPQRGETLIHAGRSYRIAEVRQLVHSQAEHVFTIAPGSKL